MTQPATHHQAMREILAGDIDEDRLWSLLWQRHQAGVEAGQEDIRHRLRHLLKDLDHNDTVRQINQSDIWEE